MRRHCNKPLSAAIAAALVSGTTASTTAVGQDIDFGNLGTRGFRILGDTDNDRNGTSLVGIGDINGDGLGDVFSGSPEIPGGADTGRAYVVLGRSASTDVDVRAISNGFAVNGGFTGDRAAFSVSGVGDLNGDGFEDFAVGEPYADVYDPDTYTTYTNGGKVYVVFGGTDTSAVNLASIGSRGFTVFNEEFNGYAGASVSGAGDVNGDGFDDLLLSVPSNSPSPSRAVVIFGSASPVDVDASSVGAAGFNINLPAPNLPAALKVSGAGDVNGDGLDDVLVAPLATNTAYVVFGKTSSSDVNAATLGAGGFQVTGNFSGGDAAGAGDVNGDGLHDLIFGEPSTDGDQFMSGAAFVVFGKSDTAAVATGSLGSGGFRINGDYNYGEVGTAVGGAGDVNGDGFADVLIGDDDPEFGGVPGEAFVVFGKSSTTTVSLGTLGSLGLSMIGEGANDRTGASVSAVGDVNGDGLGDWAVGAPRGQVTRMSVPYSDAGKSYVVFSTETPATTATFRAHIKSGDAPKIGFGVVGDQSNHGTPDGRFWLDFATGSGGGVASASEFQLMLNRDSSDIDLGSDALIATANWQGVNVDRSTSLADVTVRYLDSEIPGGVNESDLDIWSAPSISGPWTRLATTIDAARNLATTLNADANSFFALAVAPEIAVRRGAATFFNDGDNDALGTAPVGTQNLTYTIENNGDASMSVSPPTFSNASNVSNIMLSLPASTIAAGSNAVMSVSFDVDLEGPFTFDIDLVNGDPDENPFDLTISGTGDGDPNLDLEDSGATPIADGGTHNIGSFTAGTRVSQTYTIRNTGTADLNLGTTPVTATGLVNAANFAVTTSPAAVVAPGGSTMFTVEFDVLLDGSFQLDMDVSSDSPGETIYDVRIAGTAVGDPEIDVQQPAGTSRLDGSTRNIGNRNAGPVSLNLTIENQGTADLTFPSQPTVSGLVNVSNVVPSNLSSIAPGGSATLTLNFDVDLEGTFQFDLDIPNDDSDENPYDLRIRGTGVGTPEIDVAGPDGPVADMGMDDLGPVIVGRVDRTYTITNSGTGTLAVGAVTASGESNVTGFDVTSAPPASLAPMTSGNFSVEFFAADFGAFSLDLQISNDDADESPYDIAVVGEGTDVQAFPDLASLLADDQFGAAVATSGNYFAVGIPGSDAAGPNEGRVIVYRIDGNTLLVDAIVEVPDGFTAMGFGSSLALEGNLLLVGAPGEPPGGRKVGSTLQAALFERVGQTWQIKQPITGSGGMPNDQFGAAVALSGGMMVIGAPADAEMGSGAGAAYAFGDDGGGNFVQIGGKITPSASQAGGFGSSVAASLDKFAIGSPTGMSGGLQTGVATMFQAVGTNLSGLGTVQASSSNGSGFGTSLAMSGNALVVGAPGENNAAGAAYTFNFNGAQFLGTGQVAPPSGQAGAGFGSAVSIQGGNVAVGAPGFNASGSVFVYSNGELARTIGALEGMQGFGASLSLTSTGLVMGAPEGGGSAGGGAVQRDPGLIMVDGFE